MNNFVIEEIEEIYSEINSISNTEMFGIIVEENSNEEFLEKILVTLKQNNLKYVKASITSEDVAIYKILSISTIESIRLNLDFLQLDDLKYLKDSLSKIECLKEIDIRFRGKNNLGEMLLKDFLPDQLNHVEKLELYEANIDDSFNSIFVNSRLNLLNLNVCNILDNFEFKINLQSLTQFTSFGSRDTIWKSFQNCLKGNQNEISLNLNISTGNKKEEFYPYFIQIITNHKINTLTCGLDKNIKQFLKSKLKFQIKNLNTHLIHKDMFLLKSWLPMINGLESIEIHQSKEFNEIHKFLKKQKDLKKITIDGVSFDFNLLFDLIKDSSIESLKFSDSYLPDEFYDFLKNDKKIKELTLGIYEKDLSNVISLNNSIETLNIYAVIPREFYKSLSLNNSVKTFSVYIKDSLEALIEYMETNPALEKLFISLGNSHSFDQGIIKSLQFNTHLKEITISTYNGFIGVENGLFDKIFQYNYSLKNIMIQDQARNYQLIYGKYLKRNNDISKIYKMESRLCDITFGNHE